MTQGVFKNVNVFSVLAFVAVFALVLRLFSFADFSMPVSVAESTPPSQELKSVTDSKAEELKSGAAAPAAPAAAPAAAVKPPDDLGLGEKAFSASELDTLQALSKRRDELDARARKVAEQEALLKAVEGEVDRKVGELNKIRGELVALLGQQKTAQDERTKSLVKIYESMKPKEAARIFDTLDMDVLISVLTKMSEKKSAPILAAMDPEKARRVTIRLSEEKKLPDLPAPVPVPPPAGPAKKP